MRDARAEIVFYLIGATLWLFDETDDSRLGLIGSEAIMVLLVRLMIHASDERI